jgi:hypothetical protein
MVVEHDLDAIAEAFQEFARKQSFTFCAEETH